MLEGGTSLMKQSDRVWIWFALGAGLFFSLTNVAIQEINDEVGILCSMYLSVGAIISSSCYFLLMGSRNTKQGKPWWTSQDYVVEGKIQWVRVAAFLLYCFLFFLIQNLAVVTLYFAERAQINSGTISTIWNACPLFTAIMDLIMFN
mmetsp:Transcript_13146/g.22240  ORF Transcript_13146/g.22240 Transcript_13146/m.22240 type:complete len:147 (+) Transcript_13146:225-665(+)